MIRAQSADGVVHEFPDGTSDTVVDQAMRAYATESAVKDRVRQDATRRVASTPGAVRALTNGVTWGGMGDIDALGAGLETGVNNALSKVGLTKGAGYSPAEAYHAVKAANVQGDAAFGKEHPFLSALSTGAGAVAGLGSGLVSNLITKGVPAAGVAAEGLPVVGGVLSKFAASRAALPTAARAITVGAGTAGAYGGLSAPEGARAEGAATGAKVGAITAGVLHGGGQLVGALRRPASIAATDARNATRGVLADFDQAGVDPTLAAVKGGAASKVANAIAENPVGFRQRAQLSKSTAQAGDEARRIASQYGDSRGPQLTGESIQAGVTRFAKDKTAPTSLASKAEQLYDKAFLPIETAEAQAVERSSGDFAQRSAQAAEQHAATIKGIDADHANLVQRTENDAALRSGRGGEQYEPEGVPKPAYPEPPQVTPQVSVVTPTETISALKEMASRVNAPNLSNMITDGRIRSILEALQTDASQVRFNDLRALRTWVREAQGNDQLRQGLTRAGLQRLEGALTGDIYASAERLAGPQALKGLQRADDVYRTGMDRINSSLRSFDDAGSGESAYAKVLQAAGSTGTADARKLLTLKRSLAPDEWGDVASNVVRGLGKPTKGATGQVGDEGFSVNTFLSNYNSLSPRGKNILFGSVGGGGAKATALQTELERLARVADKLKAVEKGANASNSAVATQAVGTVLGGIASLPLALKGLAGLAATGEAMTNPAFVRWLYRATEKEPSQWRAHLKQLQVLGQTNPQIAKVVEGLKLAPPVAAASAAAPSRE